jgi:hypothetical protein
METNATEHPSKRCVKCLTAIPVPDWIVNKDMAYCAECAALLHLGESKESRMFNDMHERAAGISPDAVPSPVPEDIDMDGIGLPGPEMV